MEVRTIELEVRGKTMPVYEAVPTDERRGAVVVFQEAFGLTDHIQEVTGRFAEAGYWAVAPALFHRSGSPVIDYGKFEETRQHFAATSDADILDDLDAVLDHFENGGGSDLEVAVVGFCFGGRAAFLAASQRELGAAVCFYGGGIVTPRIQGFPALVESADLLETPWLGMFGDDDNSIPVDDVERLAAALEEAAVDVEVIRYAGAGHGFFCDQREAFNAEIAADAWQRTLAWLEQHVRQPSS